MAMIEPIPSKLSDGKGRIWSTITLRIGSSNPGAPAVFDNSRNSSTVRSCAPIATAQANTQTVVRAMRIRIIWGLLAARSSRAWAGV